MLILHSKNTCQDNSGSSQRRTSKNSSQKLSIQGPNSKPSITHLYNLIGRKSNNFALNTTDDIFSRMRNHHNNIFQEVENFQKRIFKQFDNMFVKNETSEFDNFFGASQFSNGILHL